RADRSRDGLRAASRAHEGSDRRRDVDPLRVRLGQRRVPRHLMGSRQPNGDDHAARHRGPGLARSQRCAALRRAARPARAHRGSLDAGRPRRRRAGRIRPLRERSDAPGSGRRRGHRQHGRPGGDRSVRRLRTRRRCAEESVMKRIAFGLTLVVSMLALATADAQAPGKWLKLAPFPEPSEELYGAAAGGKFYVFGGLAPGWKPKALAYEYDPAANAWTKKKPMALASHHVAFTELGGKLYAFGGFVPPSSGPPAWVPVDNAWEYDPATDTWK